MPTLANVALTDTFDTWRIRTNQIIVSLNSVDSNSTNALSVSNFAAVTANVAYNKGNSAATTANSSYNQSNTAYTQANTGYTQANTAYTVANNAFGKANAANVLAYTTSLIASPAYDKANGANVLAYTTSLIASPAYDKANGANVLAYTTNITASAAYDKANGANVLAFNTGTGANAFTSATVSGANTISIAAFAKANAALANTTGSIFSGILYITANLGIGLTTTPAARLHVVGDIVATGDITSAYSDERLKDILEPVQNATSKILTLDTFYYKPNQTAIDLGLNNERHIGLSAQQVQRVVSEVVKKAPIGNDYLTVQYERLVPLLIASIKELTERIEKLENGTQNRKCNCSKRHT